MNTENIVRNAKVLIRAESIVADIHLRALMAKSVVQVLAGLVAVFGAVMLGIAAFFALEIVIGRVWAAVVVGAGALALAAVLALIASNLKPQRDLELAQNLRDTATDRLVADLKAVEADVLGFARAVRNPMDGLLASVVVPLAMSLMRSLRRGEKPEARD